MAKDFSITYKGILKVALPLMAAGFMNALLLVTDTAFLGHLGEQQLGGVGNGGLLYFVLLTIGLGLSTGAQIIMGRRNGEENYGAIGKLLTQTLYILAGLSVILFAFIQLGAPSFLELTVASDNILGFIKEFLDYRSYGIFFALLNTAFMGFYVGIARTRILAYNSIVIVSLNIFLDYSLIYGEFGFPRMEVAGAALASVISEATGFVFISIVTFFAVDREKYQLFKLEPPSGKRMKEIMKTAGPLMAQNIAALGGWYVFFSIIEHLGERSLSISHIIRGIYVFLMIPVFSLANSTNTLTSNLLGKKEPDKVFQLVGRSIILGLSSNIILAGICLLFKEQVVALFTNNESLIADTFDTLYVIIGAMLFFTVATVLFQAACGTGNTVKTLTIEIITITSYLILAYILVHEYQVDVAVAWATEFLYFGLLGALCYIYLKKGKWRTTII